MNAQQFGKAYRSRDDKRARGRSPTVNWLHNITARTGMGNYQTFCRTEQTWGGLSTATFAEIFNGLLFRSILRMCVQNLKFVSLAIPGSLDTLTLPFLPTFWWAFVRLDLWMCRPNLQSVALPVLEIIAIAVLGWGWEPQILRKGRP